MKRPSYNVMVPAQMAAAFVALAALTLWPPASGAIMLVPLVHRDANALATLALAGGGLLLGSGPLRGSLVVVGDRARIARQIRSWDVLLVAAPPAGCGARIASGAAA